MECPHQSLHSKEEASQDILRDESKELLREQLQNPLLERLLRPRIKKKKTRILVKKRKPVKKPDFYQCPMCPKKFPKKEGWSQHQQTHSDIKAFPCDLCDYKTAVKRYLATHKKKVHREKTKYECEVCGIKFTFKNKMRNHMRVHTGEKPYTCEICSKSFSASYSLNTHMFIHTGEKPYQCAFCEYACRDCSTLRKHEAKHMGTEQLYQCNMCRKSYKAKWHLKAHVAEAHFMADIRSHKCEHCGSAFKYKQALSTHIQAVHLKTKRHKCEICNVEIANKANLSAHMLTHVDIRAYNCTYRGCKKSFKDKQALKRHTLTHYPEKQYRCEVCNRLFARKCRYTAHLRQHCAKETKMECDYCGACFKSKIPLGKHIKRDHGGTKKYMCDLCHFVTHKRKNIVVHIKIHNGEYERHCNICNKTFKKPQYLKMHYLKTHDIEFKKINRKVLVSKEKLIDIKHEPMSDEENPDLIQMLDQAEQINVPQDLSLIHSEKVLSEDMARNIIEKNSKRLSKLPDVVFDDFFINTIKKDLYTVENAEKYEKGVDRKKLSLQKESLVKLMDRARHKMYYRILEKTRRLYNKRMKNFDNKSNKREPIIIKFYNKNKDNTSQGTRNGTSLNDNCTNTTLNDTNNSTNVTINVDQTSLVDYKNGIVEIPNAIKKDTFLLEDTNELTEKTSNDTNAVIDTSQNEIKNIITSQNIDDISLNDTRNLHKKITSDTNSVNKDKLHNTKEDIKEENDTENDTWQNNSNNNKEDLINKTNDVNRNEILYDMKINEDTFDDTENIKTHDTGGVKKVSLDHELEISFDSNEVSLNCDNKDMLSDDKFSGNDSDFDEPLINLRPNRKIRITTQQCYVCFKLFPTKDELLDHCKIHFDYCSDKALKKCPLCDYVTTVTITGHLKRIHNIRIKLPYRNMKDKKTSTNGSRYYYDINDANIKEVEIIPTVRNLNKQACMKIDEMNRKINNEVMSERVLTKKGKEWVVEQKTISVSVVETLPTFSKEDYNAIDCKNNNYVDRIMILSRLAKKRGIKMYYPCDGCEKVCRNLSALRLHSRKHDPNAKPFKPKVWKHKLKDDLKKAKNENNKSIRDETVKEKPANTEKATENRYQKPHPIVNKHKCDPQLKEFYENNIRGGDVEFWQFLKIFNKMERENINDFSDLENRTDFGIHYKEPEKEISEKTRVTKAIRKAKIKLKYKRVIRISKKEYMARNILIDKLREKIDKESQNA